MALLFASRNNACALGADSGNKFGADFFEQSKRQRSITDACGVSRSGWPQVRTRPNKTVGFGQDYPRPLVIELEPSFDERGDFDGEFGIGWRRVRDRQYCHHPLVVLACRHKNDGTRPVLHALLLSAPIFFRSQITVTDDEAWSRFGKRHTPTISVRDRKLSRLQAPVSPPGPRCPRR